MPRFTARNAVVVFNILLLTALFLHLKTVLWDNPGYAAPELADLETSPERQASNDYEGSGEDNRKLRANTGAKIRRTAIVVASQASENATWLEEHFPQWEQNIYRVDNPDAPLTVPKNKGRESMVYLTCVYSAAMQARANGSPATS
jgi:hypothetical protein